MTPAVTCAIASSIRQVRDAQRVRWLVYGEEEAMLPPTVAVEGREIDLWDASERTVHFVAYSGVEPVGTIRLVWSDGCTDGALWGKPGIGPDAASALTSSRTPAQRLAEVTRFCILRRFRGTRVAATLFKGLCFESRRLGITHWAAGANMATDCREDASIAFRVARDRGYCETRDELNAAPARSRISTPERRPFYTVAQREQASRGDFRELPLPGPMTLFARRMNARFVGGPVYDVYFGVFSMPLVAALPPLPTPALVPANDNHDP